MDQRIYLGVALGLVLTTFATLSTTNVKFDIILPDGQRYNGVVLSSGNYTELQNNVGVFTVPLKSKQILHNGTNSFEHPNTGYCPLAKVIYDSHLTTYPKIANDFKKYMLPDWCDPELNPPKSIQLYDTLEINDTTENIVVVPEFGTIAVMILAVAIISIIAVSAKTRLKK